MNRYLPDEVTALVRRIAQAAGVSADDATIFADALVDADLQGTSTHGVSRVNVYIRRIQRGLIDPRAILGIARSRPSVMVVDAANGLGQVQATRTLDAMMPVARAQGCVAATIRHSQHFGALSWYCNRAAAQDMILVAMTNCEPSMSPEGGCQAYFGTNPIAASFPTGKGFTVKIDLSTSVVARGNIVAARRKGVPIPPGWALDQEGNPTTDAEKAILGTVLTMAGHKGYALALMVELLSGVLSGAAIGPEVGSMYVNPEGHQDVGHFFFLIDIAAFMDVAEFRSRVDRTIDEIKACRRRPGVQEILIPGERSARRAEENRRRGIPLGQETINEFRTLCAEMSIAFDLNPQVAGEGLSRD